MTRLLLTLAIALAIAGLGQAGIRVELAEPPKIAKPTRPKSPWWQTLVEEIHETRRYQKRQKHRKERSRR